MCYIVKNYAKPVQIMDTLAYVFVEAWEMLQRNLVNGKNLSGV
jgi:hypothetical protein